MLIRDVPKCMRYRVCDTGMHTGFSMASISDIQDLSNKY
jgi:hypothetical protein